MHIGKKILVALVAGLFFGSMFTWAYTDEGVMGLVFVVFGVFVGLGILSVLGSIIIYITGGRNDI